MYLGMALHNAPGLTYCGGRGKLSSSCHGLDAVVILLRELCAPGSPLDSDLSLFSRVCFDCWLSGNEFWSDGLSTLATCQDIDRG